MWDNEWHNHFFKWVHLIPTHFNHDADMLNSQNLMATTHTTVRDNKVMQKNAGLHLRTHCFAHKPEAPILQIPL